MQYIINFQLCIYSIFLISTTLVDSQRPAFREDYRYEKSFKSYYKLHTTAVVWSEARVRCEAEGAKLMWPEHLDEFEAMPLVISSIHNQYPGVFIGIHDLYSEKSFVTLNGDAVFDSYLNLQWERDEPMPRAGRCVAMRRSGKIFVQPCTQPLPFICKVNGTRTLRTGCTTYDPRWKQGPNKTSCYLTHTDPQKWSTAYATCQSAGGSLAVTQNEYKKNYIHTLYKTISERLEPKPTTDFAFLGFNDLFHKHHYRTIHDERVELMVDNGYSERLAQCPGANQTSHTEKELRCGGIKRGGSLATGDCNIPAMFICEKKANATSPALLLAVKSEETDDEEEVEE